MPTVTALRLQHMLIINLQGMHRLRHVRLVHRPSPSPRDHWLHTSQPTDSPSRDRGHDSFRAGGP